LVLLRADSTHRVFDVLESIVLISDFEFSDSKHSACATAPFKEFEASLSLQLSEPPELHWFCPGNESIEWVANFWSSRASCLSLSLGG
jgi:hypothetical protein